MARKKRTRKGAAKPVTGANKRRYMKHLMAAEDGVKTLAASVKALRAHAVAGTYVGGAPMAGRARRRKRG